MFRFFWICLFTGISFGSMAQFPSSIGGTLGRNLGNMSSSSSASSAKKTVIKTHAHLKQDTLHSVIPYSLRSKENGLDNTVYYAAEDSTILDVTGKVVHLYGKAVVEYGDINLQADYIRLDWNKNEVFANGSKDTTKAHKIIGKPIFSQGNDQYNTDTIRYNFKSRKAIIKGIVTQQGDGFVEGAKVKKDAQDDLYLTTAKYTTCNLADPHFYISAKKIKMVSKKQLISGPFNIVINDIPLPIGLPFGFFPVPKNKTAGTPGILIGTYGEEPNGRGFYLQNFGYYLPINEYIGARILGEIYTNGSWGVGVESEYIKKYHYAGNLRFKYNRNQTGTILQQIVAQQDGSSTIRKDFSLSWSHTPKSSRPDRSFSASVNLQSNGYVRNNVLLSQVNGLNNYLTSTTNSAIQYSRAITKNIRLSTSLNANQNNITKQLNLSGNYSLSVPSFNPFIPEKKKIGRKIEEFRIGMDLNGTYSTTNDITYQTRSTTLTDYNILGVTQSQLTEAELKAQSLGLASTTTKIQTINSIDDLVSVLKLGQLTNTFSVPISLPNFKIARYINFSPSISLQGNLYTKELKYTYYDSYDPTKDLDIKKHSSVNATGETHNFYKTGGNGVLIDTLKGFFPTFRYSYSGSFNTRAYGTYNFGKKGRLQAIRHTLIPSIGLSYSPDLTKTFSQYTQIRTDYDATATIANVPSYQPVYRYPYIPVYRYLPKYIGNTSSQTEAGNINFSLANIIEAKLRSKSDTAKAEFQKITLLDNLNISGSYNFLNSATDRALGVGALSNISLGANTSILKGLISLNTSATLDPYYYKPSDTYTSGIKTAQYAWKINHDLGHISNFNASLSTRLTPAGLTGKNSKPQNTNDPTRDAQLKFIKQNPDLYVDFNIPWSLNIAYNVNYSKNGLAPSLVTQALTFQGDVSLTEKWKIGFSTGYDIQFKAPTLTSINIIRNLHCWDMSFSWTPIAGNTYRVSSFSFELRPKAALLQELKLTKRRTTTFSGY